MTLLADRVHDVRGELGRARRDTDTASLVEHGAVAALLLVWAAPLTRATGGRGVHNELVFSAVLVAVLLAVRVWRAPSRAVTGSLLVAAAALIVCLVTPTGWSGSDAAAGYVMSAGAYLVARRYVRDTTRLSVIAGGICLAATYEFLLSLRVWWQAGDPAAVMSGTFYWHNPFAAYLLPGAIIGLALIADGRSPWHIVGWLSVPLCTAGVVISSSRASQAVLVVGLVVVVALAWRQGRGRWRAVSGVGVAAAFTAVLPGPPLFSHYASPLASTAARAATGQSLAQNGYYRTEFWREALGVFGRHPFTGGGYHSMAQFTVRFEPFTWAESQFAHNGYLQTMTDGGLLLAIPVLAAAGLAAWSALRRLWSLVAQRSDASLLTAGIAVALLGAMAHSAVDFDWSHPSVMIEAALLAACVMATITPGSPDAPAAPAAASTGTTTTAPLVARLSAGLLIVALAVTCVALHDWQRNQGTGPSAQTTSSAALLARSDGRFGDYRSAALVLSQASTRDRTLSRAQAVEALRLTATESAINVPLALSRDDIAARFGLDPAALADAVRLTDSVSAGRSTFAAQLAGVYLDSGEAGQARQLLATDLATQAKNHADATDLQAELTLWARTFGSGSAYACEVDMVIGLAGAPPVAALPAPTAACPRGSSQG